MAKQVRPRWSERRRRWVANVGPPDKKGQAREIGAPRRILRHDLAGAWRWLVEATADRPDDQREKIREAMLEAIPPPPEPPPTARPPKPPASRSYMSGDASRGDGMRSRIILALLGLPPVVALPELADALGLAVAKVVPTIALMVKGHAVESWPDERKAGTTMVMLSARSLDRLGLELCPSGRRWIDREPKSPPAPKSASRPDPIPFPRYSPETRP